MGMTYRSQRFRDEWSVAYSAWGATKFMGSQVVAETLNVHRVTDLFFKFLA